LSGDPSGEPSAVIRERVRRARQLQQERFHRSKIYCNAHMSPRQIRKHCPVDGEARTLLDTAMERLGLSARAYDRILKVARTIGDLEGTEVIQPEHIAEAIQYRSLDRTPRR
jgi:magnesium chelatase family protein